MEQSELMYRALFDLLARHFFLIDKHFVERLSCNRQLSHIAIHFRHALIELLNRAVDINRDLRKFSVEQSNTIRNLLYNMQPMQQVKSLTEISVSQLTNEQLSTFFDQVQFIQIKQYRQPVNAFYSKAAVELLAQLLINSLANRVELNLEYRLEPEQRHALEKKNRLKLKYRYLSVFHILIMTARTEDLFSFLDTRNDEELSRLANCSASALSIRLLGGRFHRNYYSSMPITSPAYFFAVYHGQFELRLVTDNHRRFLLRAYSNMQRKYFYQQHPPLLMLCDRLEKEHAFSQLQRLAPEQLQLTRSRRFFKRKPWYRQQRSQTCYAVLFNQMELLQQLVPQAIERYATTANGYKKAYAFHNLLLPLVLALVTERRQPYQYLSQQLLQQRDILRQNKKMIKGYLPKSRLPKDTCRQIHRLFSMNPTIEYQQHNSRHVL